MMWIGAIAVLALLSLLYVGWRLRSRRRRLSGRARSEIERLWSAMLQQEDPVRRVLEADAIFDKALGELGYAGTLGEKLRAAGSRFHNIDAVWAAHKLRNHLAHQPGDSVRQKELETAVRVLRRAIESLF